MVAELWHVIGRDAICDVRERAGEGLPLFRLCGHVLRNAMVAELCHSRVRPALGVCHGWGTFPSQRNAVQRKAVLECCL